MPKKLPPIVFERPPYANEVFTQDGINKFDKLVGWQRKLVEKLVEHGNLEQAAVEAGVSKNIKSDIDQKKSVKQALQEGGINTNFIVAHLMECILAKSTTYDRNGMPHEAVDLKTKLKALEFTAKLAGYLDGPNDATSDNTQDVLELFEKKEVK